MINDPESAKPVKLTWEEWYPPVNEELADKLTSPIAIISHIAVIFLIMFLIG